MLKIGVYVLFGAKMLIDAQITAQNRNSRWRPSVILDFSKFDFWPMVLVRRLIFHLHTKFGAKMLIDAEIMAKNLICILDFRKTDFWQIGCLVVSIFQLCTKFGAKMLIGAQIIAKNLNSRWRPSAILDFDFGPETLCFLCYIHCWK